MKDAVEAVRSEYRRRIIPKMTTTGSNLPAIDNPLAGIQVGSQVNSVTGKFSVPVINGNITSFINLPSTSFRLTGVSAFLNTSEMNQGSLSISGSYGISGVEKLSGALTFFAAKGTSQSTKTISLSMNCIKWAGVEYIDFNNLDVAALVSSLDSAAKTEVLHTLACFQDLLALTKDMSEADFEAALTDTSTSGPAYNVRQAFEAWVTASEQFRTEFGSGVVAAVLWGGWGSVTAEIQSKTNQMNWKVGGTGSFEYQGAGANVKISASYGQQDNIFGSNATASVQGSSNGGCVLQMTSRWWDNLSEAAQAGLTTLGENPVQDPVALQASIDSPTISPFNPPSGSSDPALKNLPDVYTGLAKTGSLGMLSTAAAWHAVKSTYPTLSDFKNNASQPSNANTQFPIDLTASIIPASEAEVSDAGHFGLRAAAAAPLASAVQSSGGGNLGSAFEAMGIWVADWAELFPWLCSGRQNGLPAAGKPQMTLALKIMHQDMLTLSSLYWRYASSGIVSPSADINLSAISDDFAASAAAIALFVSTNLSTASAGDVKAMLQRTVTGMSPHSQSIYKIWDSMGFLRLANLGLGITCPAWNGGSVINSFFTQTVGLTFKTINWGVSEFNETAKNYDVFAPTVKASPFILPGGEVYLFLMGFPADASDQNDYAGLLKNTYMWDGLTKTVDDAVKFSVASAGGDPGAKKLTGVDINGGMPVSAYPLPFDAANGVQWKGCTVSTGLGDLVQKLQDLLSTLDKLPAWSLDGDYWTAEALTTNFSLSRIHLSYVGVVDEPANIFPSIKSAGRAKDDASSKE